MKSPDTKQIKARIDNALATKVELLLLDRTTGRVRYGAQSKLITFLLTRWVNAVENGTLDPRDFTS